MSDNLRGHVYSLDVDGVLASRLTIVRIATAEMPTSLGKFDISAYKSKTSAEEFIALCKGHIQGNDPTLVRIHSQCLTGESFGSRRCDCNDQLRLAMQMIEREGKGVIVYQLQEGRGIGIVNKIRAYALQDYGADTVEANQQLGLATDVRDYKQCVEILMDLGIRQVRLLSNNPQKLAAVTEAGLQVKERIPLEVEPSGETLRYLQAKKYKLGHIISSIP